MGGSEVLLKPKYCVVLLVDFRFESGVIPDIVNSDGAPAHEAGALDKHPKGAMCCVIERSKAGGARSATCVEGP
jgi:hypothetical protein